MVSYIELRLCMIVIWHERNIYEREVYYKKFVLLAALFHLKK